MRIRETRKPRPICRQETSMLDGGHHNPYWSPVLVHAPGLFKVFEDRRPHPRPEPRTIPLLVALPLVVWLWYRGEL